MDWATEASVEIILAIFFGLFIGWIIVTAIKASRANEERRERTRERKKTEIEKVDFPFSNSYLDTIAKIERESAMKKSLGLFKTQKKENSEVGSEYWKSVDAKVAKQKFLDQLYEASKSQGKTQPRSTEESRDIDEYHK